MDTDDPRTQKKLGRVVEASPEDCYWGIGLAEHDPRARDRSMWRGLNWLGEVLTELREDFAREPGA